MFAYLLSESLAVFASAARHTLTAVAPGFQRRVAGIPVDAPSL